MPDSLIPPDLATWLEGFRATCGRPPRLLHIGNIANNAYLNAKFLNRAGLDCDVMCPDYYHIMACPEWEEADYRGDTRDDFYPAWERVDLRGFDRPRWFVQGPAKTCINYLTARRNGHAVLADKLWVQLRAERDQECARQRGELPPASRRDRFSRLAGKAARKFWKLPYIIAIHTPIGRRVYWAATGGPFRRSVRRLVREFGKVFPDRPDRLRPADVQDYGLIYPGWKRLLRSYDLVVGYATDGIYPMLTGDVPYIAYEHGTIRNLPFETTAQGRLCALTYRLAAAVFITNCDNKVAADRLGLKAYRFVPHPINEDEHPTADPDAIRNDVRERLGADFVVFHPSRQHWGPQRNTSWDKGNDILVEGFARFVKEVNPRAGAVLVDWGQTVPQTKELLGRLGIADRVLWVPPQPTPRMNAYVRACDVLADQFCIGAFGSTMPRGLMLGTPNLIYLNEDVHRWCLPEMPPVLNARTPDEVFSALTRLYRDPRYSRQVADDGRTWYAKYHSSCVVVDAFTCAVRRIVRPNAAGAS